MYKRLSFLMIFTLMFGLSSLNATNVNDDIKIIKSKVVIENIYKTYPGDVYFILFNDGCYHLGKEVEYPNGEVWWEPIGIEYGYDYCCETTICMSEEEFERFC